MKYMTLKNFFFLTTFVCFSSTSFGQTYEIDVEDGNTITTCSGTFTDSNPSTTGNYADNEDYTVTFCSGSGDFLTFDFDVSGFFDPLGAGDTLYMYDGTTTTGDLIMKIDNTDDPAFSEFMLSTFSTCVTFHFVSDGAGNNDGWAANISCPSPPVSCNNNEVAADIALQAPYLCNLDGYCGNTSSYYHEDLPNNMIGTGGNCPSTQAFLGTIQNNSWVRFEATTNTVSLDFVVTGCADGIQVGILQFDGANWQRFSPCAPTDGGNNGTFTVVGSGLTIGETYYLMMDGNMGANCDYLINVTGGVGVAIVDAGVDQVICGGNVNLTATGPGTAIYSWHSLDGLIIGAVGANQTFSPLVTTTYVVEVTGGGVCENQTDTVVVTVGAGAVDPGTNGAITYCNIDAASDLYLELGGTPDLGGVWSPVMNSTTGVFTPGTDPAGTYTYTVTGGCGTASAEVVVSVDTGTDDPGANGAVTFCNTDAATDLFLSLGGTPDAGGAWTPALTSGTGVFNPAADAATTYTYTVTNACGAATAEVAVTVDIGIDDPGTNGAVAFCNTDAATDLFLSLGGTPDAGGAWTPALTSGTGVFNPAVDAGVTYTYAVTNACGAATAEVAVTVDIGIDDPGTNGAVAFCNTDAATDLFLSLGGTPDAGGAWTPALTSGTGVFNPAVDAGVTYTYAVTNACGTASAEVVVSVDSGLADAGLDGSITLCVGDPATDLFNELNGTPLAGGGWVPVMTSGTGVFDPGSDAANTYTYSLTNTCGTSSSEVIVAVVTSPDAGTNGTVTFCENDATADLLTSLNGTPDAGGSWTPALTSGTGIFDPANDNAGTYTYTINTSCGSATAEVDVTLNLLPDAGGNSNATFCSSGAATDLATYLTGTPELGGTWLPVLISGTGVFDPTTDVAGTYTYTLTNSCGSTASTVDVMITVDANAGTANAISICSSENSFDILDSLSGTPDAGGTWAPALFSGTDSFDPAMDAAGVYTYTATNSCGTSTAEMTVNFIAMPDAGVGNTYITCSTSPSVDLLTVMNGSPEDGGVWSPSLTSGTNFFDPEFDPMLDYTYTVSNSCGSNSSIVTITSDGADCDQHVYVPNVFSPDGNGENDELYVRGKGIDSFTFSLFNRWGQLIFETSSLDLAWDGTFGGKPVNAGVFVYVLKGQFANGEEIDQKGNVTLVK
ncbi:MAG: gliding motility-associated-like protein [Arenicella sp.]|jgi:gliding motility-associated-like protein